MVLDEVIVLACVVIGTACYMAYRYLCENVWLTTNQKRR